MLDLDLYCDFVKQHPYLGKPIVKDFILLNVALKHVITKYLSIQDIMSLSETCKYFYSICTSDIIWRYIYEKCFKMYDTVVRKNVFYKACQAIYAGHSQELELQLLIKYGYPLSYIRSVTNVNKGAIPKQIQEYQEDADSEVCLCENCYPSIPLNPNASMTNLYKEHDRPLSSSDASAINSDTDTTIVMQETSVDIKKLTTSISQIKIGDKSTSGDENDNNDNYLSSKTELKRRLALMIKHAMKYPIDCDDCLPGDKSTKYALKYTTTAHKWTKHEPIWHHNF